MIRLVVAVVLTVATFAAAAPAIESARATATDAEIEATIERVERAGQALATTEDATPTPSLAASRRVEFQLPAASLTTAAVSFVAVGGKPGGPGNRSVVAYGTTSGSTRLRALSLPIPVRTPVGPVVFRDSGRHAVSLSLVRDEGQPVVRLTRG